MRRILLLLAGFLPLTVAAGDKSKPITLNGSWKETARMDLKNRPVSYTDTIRMGFLVGNEYTWRQKGSFIFRGTYTATEKEIDMGMRRFNIVSRSGGRMVLSDETNKYEFTRFTEQPQAEDNSAAHTGDRVQTAERYDGVGDVKKLTGKWTVYKRTSSVKGEVLNYQRIIRDVHIGGAAATGGRLGNIFSTKDPLEAPSWYIDRFANSTLFCKGRDARQLKVLKCDDGELILQEGTITYFFKQF